LTSIVAVSIIAIVFFFWGANTAEAQMDVSLNIIAEYEEEYKEIKAHIKKK